MTPAAHLLPLGDTGWNVWRDVLIRSAGFPVTGMARLAAPELAELADQHLGVHPEDGDDRPAALQEAFCLAVRSSAHALFDAAAEPAFREAMTWQNPSAAATLSGMLRDGPDARRNERRRRREDLVARYLQRYSMKNDTIGFYGPMAWGRIDPNPGSSNLRAVPGPEVVRHRYAVLERWAVRSVADHLVLDPAVRPQVPVRPAVHAALTEAGVQLPGRPVLPLSPAQRSVFRTAQRTTHRPDLVAAVLADPAAAARGTADVEAAIEHLLGKEALVVGPDLPMSTGALDALSAWVDRLEGPAHAVAGPVRDALVGHRDALQAARGPEEVAPAIAALEEFVVQETGGQPHRRAGQTYAGRTTCHVEATRDLGVVVGQELLEAMGRPLGPLLHAARWLTHRTAAAYQEAFEAILADLGADSVAVPFEEFWFAALAATYGPEKVIDGVLAEFSAAWDRILAAVGGPDSREVRLSHVQLEEFVTREFPDCLPGWTEAAVHSPDVQVCAPDVEAVNAGDYHLVLGEIHIGMPSFDTSFFMLGHPEPERLVEATRADFPGGRVLPLFPLDWPRNTPRNGRHFDGGNDVYLGFADAPCDAAPDRVLPVTALTVTRRADGRAQVCGPDGICRPLIEVMAGLIGVHLFDAWKITGGGRRTPRVTVDTMVLARETWRFPAAEAELAEVTGELDRFLAGRALRQREQLPERVFARLSTEIKPFYVDFRSPVLVKGLCTAVRSALRTDPDADLTVTELLPTTEDAWLVDGQGNHYCSEIRLQVIDPRPAATSDTERREGVLTR